MAFDARALEVGLEEEDDASPALRIGDGARGRRRILECPLRRLGLILVLGDPLDGLDPRGTIVDERFEVSGPDSLDRRAGAVQDVRVDHDALDGDGLLGARLLRARQCGGRDREKRCEDRVTTRHGPL